MSPAEFSQGLALKSSYINSNAFSESTIVVSMLLLAFGSDSPADLLVNASSVLAFLRQVAPALAEGNGNLGLSQDSAEGLSLILFAVEETIGAALTKI